MTNKDDGLSDDDMSTTKQDLDQSQESTSEKSAGIVERMFEQVQNLTGTATEHVPLLRIIQLFQEDGLLRTFYINPLDPDRLEAMADAGRFLQDAREILGLSVGDVSIALGLKDKDLLAQVERGESTLSFDMIFRMASLLARHDPLPFILKFLRTYSPAIDSMMGKLGVDVIPKTIERERRFLNIYRRHDKLRSLSDDEFDRFYAYIGSTTDFILEVFETEKTIALKKAAEVASLDATDKQ